MTVTTQPTVNDLENALWAESVIGLYQDRQYWSREKPTFERAIRELLANGEIRYTPQHAADFEAGKRVLVDYRIVRSERTGAASDYSEKELDRKGALVTKWITAGWAGTNQMYTLAGLVAR